MKSRRQNAEGRRQKAEGGRRKTKGRGITHTVIEPRWMKAWKATVRDAKRQALYILAAIGLCFVGYQALLFLAARLGGG